ncbi:sensor histidine kinase [Geodermatophilus sp. YIM 151500]|uniref:sensor histidine kinase n=1 Tax=Geodermatophilus sp. YIM 151500 TaxID=2984531 RepID=UPI0021E3FF08|nr:sensor histidine kinase [Geodermatophilus sp. YIM 151500]MCV2491158.1 sensor histidine kinase [Geodermatophilus sp. YIM 151500]
MASGGGGYGGGAVSVGRLGALLAGLVLAVVTQWPVWAAAPALALVNGVGTVAFVVTGALLAEHRGQRANGRLLALTGVAWSGVWLDAWQSPLLSVVALVCPALYVTAGATVLLRYPAARLPGAAQRAFVVTLFVWLQAVFVGSALTGGVEALGALGGRPWRPAPVLGPESAAVLATVDRVGAVLLGTAFVVLLARKVRRARGLDRGELVPVVVGAVAAGVALGSFRIGRALAGSEESVTALRLVHAVALLAIPLAFAAAALRRRLERGAVADVVVGLSGVAPLDQVRERLRRALRDPGLEVLYWVPDERAWVGTDGRPADEPPGGDGRLVVPVTAGDGDRLALVLADPSLRRHGRLVEAAVSAAGLALENARLQAGIRAQLEQVRASRARIVEAGLAERRRLERDLHDGAQQRLLALTIQLGAVRTAVADEATKELVDAARADLRCAVEELRDLARGLHPPLLGQAGLGPALESVAERLPLPVRLDVPDRRWSVAAETAAYFLVCEALTNAAKHAGATSARVLVDEAGGRLRVEVADDGVGGADPAGGSGLTGLVDRIGAVGGALRISSPPGAGTRITAEIPCG